MPDDQGMLLWQVAWDVLRTLDLAVEIGAYCGKSTLYLGDACKARGAMLYSIDHHKGSPEHQPGEAFYDESLDVGDGIDTLDEWRFNIDRTRLYTHVVGVVGLSEQVHMLVGKERVALLFIDGDHDYKSVRGDFDLWERTLAHHAYVLLHDCDPGMGPYRVWQELQLNGWVPRAEQGSLKVLSR